MKAQHQNDSECSDPEVVASKAGKHYMWKLIGKYRDEFSPHQSIVLNTDNECVYILGGNGNKNSNLRYDYKTIKTLAAMPAEKTFFSTVYLEGVIYTFGGYDGQNRLDAIERYSIEESDWHMLKVKLKFALSNCACYCPEPDKVVVFGGGFSSGFSPYVEQIDVKTGQWRTLPIMVEGRDLRNKVCFVDEHAYAVGGLNSKAEKFNYRQRQWV